ncbi:hypothetical protein KY328_00850 [Candidatus Woesearchaeota archaeon]|nr:hypothetical protein [Candidatus Woesearchaeota archaeon]MBW3021444.1 hypothetical protein [Candidatus Woesearchaeota archaeon]
MKYEAVIKVIGDPEIISKAFMVEKGKFARSGFDIEKQSDSVRFVVVAEDPTALRATLNSITKLLTVFEKVQ